MSLLVGITPINKPTLRKRWDEHHATYQKHAEEIYVTKDDIKTRIM